MANRRTQNSKIQKIDEDSDLDIEFSPSQESVQSEGEQQRKYAFQVDCVSESTSESVIHECFSADLLFFISVSGLSRHLKVSS